MENVISVSFNDDAKAYQALSDLKNSVSSFTILSARLIEKVGNTYVQKDGFDADAYGENFAEGGLIGALIGILGGPLGVILGGSIGMLIGSAGDVSAANNEQDTMMEIVQGSKSGLVLVLIAQEENSDDLNTFLQKYDVKEIVREDFSEVHRKILAAEKAQKKLEKDAHDEVVLQKKKAFKKKVAATRNEIKARFAKITEGKDHS
ncbi:DUF1269 domain-containing protein [Xylocopilactobacillus apis]|uniref:DUF1269 domain-containing protein n=1 Tax=Xylocopilactobacillus apis TaxID=2932183 RepID=A0AAU9D7H4_9LACO|nr:DUF1269 domain-containing protein [Xylocopilactobacillus apis]BDR55620.1 hypothetical protein KIMC2_01820 [Xylocopilactobacillus apis]